MNVKGLSFLPTRSQLIYEFGEERWNDFFESFKVSHPYFDQVILATTEIPMEKYISFIDAMLKEFYNGDEKIYWRLGRLSAKFTLSEKGPFHAFVRSKREPKEFLSKILHRLWDMNFTGGNAKNEVEGNILHAYIYDLPKYHIYFEYVVMGYIEKALEIIGAKVKEITKVKGTAKEIHYKFVLDL